MRIPPNSRKDPIKSILKTSTSYPYSHVDHQHHVNQKNPSSFAKDIELLLLADFEQRIAENKARQQQEREKYAKERAQNEEYWAKREEDRVQREQREDERYGRETKARTEARDEQFRLLLKLVTGCQPIIPPASTPICITNSPIVIFPTGPEIRLDLNVDDDCTATINTITIDDANIADEFTTSTTTTEEDAADTPIHTDNDTPIEETEEQEQQHTRHT